MNLVVLKVRRYSHLHHEGELGFEFSNDRLCCVWFYPDDYASYLATLKEHGVLVEAVGTATADRNPEIIGHSDEHNRQSVTWQDVRLLQQDERWRQRYLR